MQIGVWCQQNIWITINSKLWCTEWNRRSVFSVLWQPPVALAAQLLKTRYGIYFTFQVQSYTIPIHNTYSVVYSLARRESELIYCILNKELTWELISSLHGALLILELTKWVRLALQSMTICWLPGPHCNRAPDWIMISKMRQWQPERKKEMRGMPINWLNSRRWIYLVFV